MVRDLQRMIDERRKPRRLRHRLRWNTRRPADKGVDLAAATQLIGELKRDVRRLATPRRASPDDYVRDQSRPAGAKPAEGPCSD